MLRLHLEHVYDYVDHIIVVEAPLTFAGAPKPLHLRDNLHVSVAWKCGRPGSRHPVHGTRATAVSLTCERGAW